MSAQHARPGCSLWPGIAARLLTPAVASSAMPLTREIFRRKKESLEMNRWESRSIPQAHVPGVRWAFRRRAGGDGEEGM